jgi:cytochrome c peroxidase
VFTLFNAWAGLTGNAQNNARASIARGQNIFNTRTFTIAGVRGLNGQASDPLGTMPFTGGCVTCHDSPNVGNHSVSLPLDIGLTGPDIVNTDLYPRYTFRNNATGETIRTSDPGRALISGKWADMSRFKGPILRGLASRAPYFHNGTSATLDDVVKFYDTRFHIGFDAQSATDLANFLRAL